MSHTEVDYLLSCGDIGKEKIDGVIFIPKIEDKRICSKHGVVEIVKVGYPYWVDEVEKENG